MTLDLGQLLALGIKTLQFEIFQAIGCQGFLGHLGQVLGRDDLVGIDIGPVEQDAGPPNVFFMIPTPWSGYRVTGIGDDTGDGRGGSGRRAHQVNHPALAHAAVEVTVAGRGTDFAFRQHAVAHAETGAAGRVGDTETGIHEDLDDALGQGLLEDLRRRRATRCRAPSRRSSAP